jgi:hypothetical protein
MATPDLSLLLSQLNSLKIQMNDVLCMPCECCDLKRVVLNGLVTYDRPLGLTEVDHIMNGIPCPTCDHCTQLGIVKPLYDDKKQEVYDAMNIIYEKTYQTNPFKV